MPSNRRPGPNRQVPLRRPKVAGLRNRTSSGGEPQPEETPELAPEERADASRDVAPKAPVAEPERVAPEVVSAAPAASADVDADRAGTADAEPAEVGAEPESAAAPGYAAGGAAAQPSTEAAAAFGPAVPAAFVDPKSSGGGALRGVAWGLWIATVVFAALAVWFGIEWYADRYTGSAANEALVSAGATSEVNGQITDAVEKLFSYDFNDTAKTETAARDLLIGPAVQRYNELFAVVKQQAPVQQLIVTTTVKNSAVTRLQGDRAELLLFVDQHAMRANTGESNTGPAQISISAEKHGDQWKISQITLR
ncbi:hypothetical protein [Saccharopolyspora sp. 5N708]|uniref:hypothetical protein n=1 Tax=Saccharopolyspora sp. 5N708 TaxID=3457424 RepID=UPI003FD62F91